MKRRGRRCPIRSTSSRLRLRRSKTTLRAPTTMMVRRCETMSSAARTSRRRSARRPTRRPRSKRSASTSTSSLPSGGRSWRRWCASWTATSRATSAASTVSVTLSSWTDGSEMHRRASPRAPTTSHNTQSTSRSSGGWRRHCTCSARAVAIRAASARLQRWSTSSPYRASTRRPSVSSMRSTRRWTRRTSATSLSASRTPAAREASSTSCSHRSCCPTSITAKRRQSNSSSMAPTPSIVAP
mmetsp:Transcript_29133/g.74975  ORF Transcript_29133/g.74975 Transcript_29133/m.74975 type:complete len:241 (-) Transcript_29133:535-1257(-)